MKEDIEQIRKVLIVELCSLPLFFITYTKDQLFFWIGILLLDSYILKYFDISKLSMIATTATKEQLRPIVVLNVGVILGFIIIAWKNFPLACYLVINDILMDVMSFFIYMKKKNKE